MEYTFSKEADKKIQEDLNTICNKIISRIKEVLSIILTGGFSRGEGPVRKEGGKFHPYNDYDIQIITKKKVSKEEIDRIASKISKELGYGGIMEIFYPFRKETQDYKNNFYVDLKCDTLKDLKKLLPRVRTYELRNHSLLLWGKDYRNLIPNYDLKKIPLAEGAKLLLDRMSQMIEYYSTEGKHEKEFLTYIIQQVYAACCTSLLMLKGEYEIGYEKSMKKLYKIYEKEYPELFKKIPDLHKKIKQFIDWKINPSKLPNKNVKEEWFIAKNNILEVSKYFFSEFMGVKINTVEELSKVILNIEKRFYLPYLDEIIKNRLGFNLKSISKYLLPFIRLILIKKYKKRLKILRKISFPLSNKKSPDLIIFGALPFLLSCINKEGINERELNEGKILLGGVYPVKGKNWEEISIDYANAYIAFFLQKI